MNSARLLTAAAFVGLLVFYLLNSGEMTDEANWGSVAFLGILGFLFIRMGSKKIPANVIASQTIQVVSESEDIEMAEEDSLDIPQAVTSEDSQTLADRKRAKVEAAKAAAAQAMAENEITIIEESPLVEVQVEVDDVHVADEFVVEVSADSIEDADILKTVGERREHHDRIRSRIEERRRTQLAEIRASTASMLEDSDENEDLVALLQQPNHNNTVLVHPQEAVPGKVYGATFVRIDESRILRLRIPMDEGFEAVEKEEKQELPPLPALDGALPLPQIDGLPPLPLPNASSALAALKDDMDE